MPEKKRDNGNAVKIGEDKNFVGASPEYQGYASVGQQPLIDDESPEKDAFDRQREHEERMTKGVGFQGFSTDGTHPTERHTPLEQSIEEQRLIKEAAVANAKKDLAEAGKDPEAEATGEQQVQGEDASEQPSASEQPTGDIPGVTGS